MRKRIRILAAAMALMASAAFQLHFGAEAFAAGEGLTGIGLTPGATLSPAYAPDSGAVDLDLSGISYSLGVRTNPMFSSAILSYQALVPYSMGSVSISVTTRDPAASVSIGGD
jgi:hypothetical protein